MKTFISTFASTVLAANLYAQVNARFIPLPDGSTQIGITNNTGIDLSAFAITVQETNGVIAGGRLTVYADPAIDAAAEPILLNQTRLINDGRRFKKTANL